MPTLLITTVPSGGADRWLQLFGALLPGTDVVLWPQDGQPDFDPGAVDYVMTWKPPPAMFARLTGLRCIFSFGAGVDAILADPDLPAGVPISRVVDPDLTSRMVDYVTLAVLAEHRDWRRLARLQAERAWEQKIGASTRQRRVGIMGLGQLGEPAARMVASLGFQTAAWARRARDTAVEGYFGAERLADFLARTDILVCLLPLTPETEGILNAETFARLPEGARVINVARGGHLVEADLLAALESGHLGGATLDVFDAEPLPPDHPFWGHPNITLTPHVASIASREARAKLVAAGIRRLEQGLSAEHLVDRSAGY